MNETKFIFFFSLSRYQFYSGAKNVDTDNTIPTCRSNNLWQARIRVFSENILHSQPGPDISLLLVGMDNTAVLKCIHLVRENNFGSFPQTIMIWIIKMFGSTVTFKPARRLSTVTWPCYLEIQILCFRITMVIFTSQVFQD